LSHNSTNLKTQSCCKKTQLQPTQRLVASQLACSSPLMHATKNPFPNQHLTLAFVTPKGLTRLWFLLRTYKLQPTTVNPDKSNSLSLSSITVIRTKRLSKTHISEELMVLDGTLFRIWLGKAHAGLLPQAPSGSGSLPKIRTPCLIAGTSDRLSRPAAAKSGNTLRDMFLLPLQNALLTL
jgi:hypothetical protein